MSSASLGPTWAVAVVCLCGAIACGEESEGRNMPLIPQPRRTATASGSSTTQATVGGTMGDATGSLTTGQGGGTLDKGPHPVVNEVMPLERGGQGWVEFFNPAEEEVELSGYTVTFSPRTPGAQASVWRVPAGGIPAGGYKVFDTLGDAVPLEVGTGRLEVTDPEGNVVQQESWEFAHISYDTSVGRWPDGRGTLHSLKPFTRGNRNGRPLEQLCGNGSINPPEECDGVFLGGFCDALGYVGGTVGCTPECTYLRAGCEVEPSSIRLNEIDVASRQVELVNIGNQPVNLRSWKVSLYQWPQASRGDLAMTSLPSSTVPGGGEFVVVDLSFVLFGKGTLGLHAPTGKLADTVEYGPGGEMDFYCRSTDGTGPWQRCQEGTMGVSNVK